VNKSIQDIFKESLEMLDQDKFDECVPGFTKLIDMHPIIIASYIQRGRAHWEMKRWDLAQADFEKALHHDPNAADAKWTMGLMDMQFGNFERGWELYDERWNSSSFASPKLKTRLPEWRPYRAYESVLVWCEQGIGDQLLYGSLIDALKSQTEKVTVMIDVRMIGLLQRANQHITFIPHKSRVNNSDYDSQIAIASIGRHFIKRSEDIQIFAAPRYIAPDPKRIEQVKQELNLQPNDFVIGLSWASTAPRIDKHKSIKLEELVGLWDIPNVKIVNLQYGKPDHDIEPFEERTGKKIWQTTVGNFFDLEGVAAIMSLCNAVVSVSNANVHIAGALGVPTYVLDANKLWYWNHKDGRNSLFYPSVKLFPRESMVAPWDKQVQELIQEIRNDFKR
jgi:tetratricopeptide (TPR) repeat protein